MTRVIGPEQEIDLGVVARGLRRNIWAILLSSALVGGATYLWSKAQPPLFSASATLLASSNSTPQSEGVFGSAIVKAPPLPDGAVAQAMQSTLVIGPLITDTQQSKAFSPDERDRLVLALRQELSNQRLRTINLTSRLEQFTGGSGIYTITGRARTPQAAAELTNQAARALLNWDRGRALESIQRAEAGFQAQLAEIDQQLERLQSSSNALDRQTLIARRANVQSNLVQLGLLENSASGILSPLSSAIAPTAPVAPRPLRNAVLATLLGLFLASGIALLRTIFDRTIRSEDDLLGLNVPTLATLPRLRQRDIVFSGIVRAARQAGLYEAIGFLRVNLLTALKTTTRPVIMVTSTAPGEGKSSVTATLADGLAASGQRVLITDANLRRGTQQEVWSKFNETGQWRQLAGSGGVRTTREAFLQPENVQVLEVEPGVDMLPAGPGIHDSLSVLNHADLERAVHMWRQQYDCVLIDSAPLLALADGLVIGRHVDAVIMICEYGRTNTQAVRNALRRAERGGLKILGAVINKSDANEDRSYGYSYSYRSKEGTAI